MMFNKDLFGFLLKVITSWQIIAVTVCLIIYFSLVSYVARMYRHPRSSSDFSFDSKPRKQKARAKAVELPESSDDEDLGLEE
jgi:hypothetical protein